MQLYQQPTQPTALRKEELTHTSLVYTSLHTRGQCAAPEASSCGCFHSPPSSPLLCSALAHVPCTLTFYSILQLYV